MGPCRPTRRSRRSSPVPGRPSRSSRRACSASGCPSSRSGCARSGPCSRPRPRFGDREYLVCGDLRLTLRASTRAWSRRSRRASRALRDREGRPGRDPGRQLPGVDRLLLGGALARRDRGRAQRLVGRRRDRLRARGFGSQAAGRRRQAAGADRRAAALGSGRRDRAGLQQALEPRSRRRAARRPDRRGRPRHHPVHERHHRPAQGRRQHAPQHHRALPGADVPRRAQPDAGGGAARSARALDGRLHADEHAALPRLGSLRRRRHAALDGREDGLDHRPLRSRAGARADRAREGHELGADGHHDPSRARPPRLREVRPLEPAQRRLRRRADVARAAAAHARGVSADPLGDGPRLRAHREHRARDPQLRRRARGLSRSRSAARCRRSRSRSATPRAARFPRAARARSTSAARW